jgi:hypothetical protein
MIIFIRPYRILFAEYFNEKNIYNIIGFHRRNHAILKDIEIIIITDQDRGDKILESIRSCGFSTKGILVVNSDLENYLKTAKMSSNNIHFDYIEYFGGISKVSLLLYSCLIYH